MSEYFHSVRLISERCRGCVNCIKRCPTEAIRIRQGKAQITEFRCIDCGECIRRCVNSAKTADTDDLAAIQAYSYNIALPAPTLYAQFAAEIPIERILGALLKLGFRKVFEVARGAEIVAAEIREYLTRPDVPKPVISSACPAVVRLIQVKFPELIKNLIPLEAPVEAAARIARLEARQQTGLPDEKIGVWFITPCPAKVTAIHQPLGADSSPITGAIAISKIYGEILKVLPAVGATDMERTAGWQGAGWALAGGESQSVGATDTMTVHGIHNVSELLELLTLDKLPGVKYIDCLACAAGCIGGPLTVENRFIAEQTMRQRLSDIRKEDENRTLRPLPAPPVPMAALRRPIEPRPVLRLDENIFRAMQKVEMMEQTLAQLPGLDCGSCGSPNCKALAEDIVQGNAVLTDCLFKLRERVHALAKEMVDLAEKLPPSLDNKNTEEKPGTDGS